jgi:hypothetical protein
MDASASPSGHATEERSGWKREPPPRAPSSSSRRRLLLLRSVSVAPRAASAGQSAPRFRRDRPRGLAKPGRSCRRGPRTHRAATQEASGGIEHTTSKSHSFQLASTFACEVQSNDGSRGSVSSQQQQWFSIFLRRSREVAAMR